ncbi:MAG: transglycosylase domain-containing protein, partial [Crocinitomicaceae bacterium]|nr:transglycosylase domain-containing protein [Crocinitomicaceae bacterium]
MKQKASSKNKSNKLKQKPTNGVVGKSKEFKLSRKWKRKFLIGTWLVVFSPFISIAILMFTIPAEELPDYALLENPVSNQASTLYADGEKVLGTFFVDNRSNVAYQELSINLVNALIATEDERYYKHSGVDTWGLIRAISGQLLGQNKGGGSTITQQLAKMMFHEMPSRDKWARVNEKLAEWVIAARLERRYTKKE